jgi:hypothetical protein
MATPDPSFFHTTVAPSGIVSLLGEKALSLMVMVIVGTESDVACFGGGPSSALPDVNGRSAINCGLLVGYQNAALARNRLDLPIRFSIHALNRLLRQFQNGADILLRLDGSGRLTDSDRAITDVDHAFTDRFADALG